MTSSIRRWAANTLVIAWRLFHSRGLRILAALAAVAVLGALLIATIYWTLFDPKWIAFLGGVLFAAMLAAATRASTVEWRLARRTLQLEKARARLVLEQKCAQAASSAFRAGEDRLRLLCESVPVPVLFVARDRRCHLHNTAAAMLIGRLHASIDGRPLEEIVGPEASSAMDACLADAFSGREARCSLPWRRAGYAATMRAGCFPFPRNNPEPTGAFIILEHPAATAVAESDGVSGVAGIGERKDDLVYLNSLSAQSGTWDENRDRLASALKENGFLLLAQPISALGAASEGTPFCEIFLRLREEEENLLPPGSFFPVAERWGMMEDLDRWVVRDLITRRHEDPEAGEPPRRALYCVNLSQAAVRSHGFARFVQKQLLDRGFDGHRLCFEIAEGDVAGSHAAIARLISMLKPFGCRFTVDAFGSTKGSFSALQGLAFDFVKIDGIVVQNILRHPQELAKVRAIVTVCRHAGLKTIAEFVEDRETLAALRDAGVDYAQGFGVARPAPLASLVPSGAGAQELAAA